MATLSVESVAVNVTISRFVSVAVNVATPLALVVGDTGVITEPVAPWVIAIDFPEMGLVYASSKVAVELVDVVPLSTTISGLAVKLELVETPGPDRSVKRAVLDTVESPGEVAVS